MKRIQFTNSPILVDLLSIKVGDVYFDLHNDFECSEITFDKRLILRFLNESHELDLIFSDYRLSESLIHTELTGKRTLDSFYRGRYQNGGRVLHEEFEKRQCFYLSFLSGEEIVVLAKNSYCLIKERKISGNSARPIKTEEINALISDLPEELLPELIAFLEFLLWKAARQQIEVLSEEERAEIRQGLAEIEEGGDKLIPHSEVQKNWRSWLSE